MAPITDLSDISGDDEATKRRQKSLDTILKQLSTNVYHDSVKSESTSSPFIKSHEGRSDDTSTTKPDDEMDSTTLPVKRTRRIKKRRNFARPKLLPNETSSTDVSETENILLHFSGKSVRNHIPLSSNSRCASVNDSDSTPPCKTDSKSIKAYDSIPGVDDITTESEIVPIGDHAKEYSSEKNILCSPLRVLPPTNLGDKLKDCDDLVFPSGDKRKGRTSSVKTLSDAREKIQLYESAEKENVPYPTYNISEKEKSTSDSSRFLNEPDIHSTFKMKGDSTCLHARAIRQRRNDVPKSNTIRDIKILQEREEQRHGKHFARKPLDLHSSENRLLSTKNAETLIPRRSVPRIPKREESREYKEKCTLTMKREENLDKCKSPQLQQKSRASLHSQAKVLETKDAETLTPERTGARHSKEECFRDENADAVLEEKTISHFQKKFRRNGSTETRVSELRNSDQLTLRRSPKSLKKEGSAKGLKNNKSEFSKGTEFPGTCKSVEIRTEIIADKIIPECSPKSRRSVAPDDAPVEATYSNGTCSVSKLAKGKETVLLRFKDESSTNYFHEVHQMNEDKEKCGDTKSIHEFKQKTQRNKLSNNTPSDSKVLSQGSLDYEAYDRSVPKLVKRNESQGFRDESIKAYFQETSHGIENVEEDSSIIIVPHSRSKSLRRSTQQSENKVLDLDEREAVNSKRSDDELSNEEDRKLNVYSTESKYFDAMSRVIERNMRGSMEEIKVPQFSWKFRGNHSSEDLLTDFDDSEAVSSGTSISRLLDELLEKEQKKQHGPPFRVAAREFDEKKLPQTPQKSHRNIHPDNRAVEIRVSESNASKISVYRTINDEGSIQSILNSEIPYIQRDISQERIIPETPRKTHRHPSTNKGSIGTSDPEFNATKTSKPITGEGSRLSLRTVSSKTTQSSVENDGKERDFDEKNLVLRRKSWRTPSMDKKLLNIFSPESITERTRNFKEKVVCLGAKGDVAVSTKLLDKSLDIEELSPGKESDRAKTARHSPRKSYQANDNGVPDANESDRSSFNSSLRNLMKDRKSPHSVKEIEKLVSKSKNYEMSQFFGPSPPGSKSHERSNLKKSRKSESSEIKYLDMIDSDSHTLRRSVRNLLKDGENIPSVREFILRSKSLREADAVADPSPIVGYVSDETLGLFPRKSRRNKLNENRGSSETYHTKFRRSTPCLLKDGESRNNVKKYSPKHKNVHETPTVAGVLSGKNVSHSLQSRKNKRSENRALDHSETRTGIHRRSAQKLLKEGDSRQSFKEYASKSKHLYETPSSTKQTEGTEKKTRPSPRRTRRNKSFDVTESVPSSRKSIRTVGSRHSIKDFTSKSNNNHDLSSSVLQKSPGAEESKEKSVRGVSRKSHRNKLPEKIILDTSDLNVASLRKSIPCILIEGENRRSVKAYITKSKNVPDHTSSAVEPWSPEGGCPGEKTGRPSPRRHRRNRHSDHVLTDNFSDTTTLRKPSSRLSRDVESRYSVKDSASKTKQFHEILPVNQRADGEGGVRSSRRKSRGNSRMISLDGRHSDLNNISASRFRSVPRLTKEGKSSVKAVESAKSRNLKEKRAKDEEIVLQSPQKSHKKLSHADLQKRIVMETDNKNQSYSIVLDILKSVLSNTDATTMQDDTDASLESKGKESQQRKATAGGKKQAAAAADAVDAHASALRASPRPSKEVDRSRGGDVAKGGGKSAVQERASVADQAEVSAVEKSGGRRTRRKSQGGRRPASSDDPFTDFNNPEFLKN